ncbi:hypothetical protein OQA88_7773 [Cercophora sp. LCS_1]
MEGLPHYSTIANSSAASYPSPSAISPQQLQQQSLAAGTQTLPPLQSGHQLMQQSPYASYPHTPRTPATPNTPGSSTSGNMATYPPPPQNGGRGAAGYPVMGNNAYQPQYPTSTAVMTTTTTAASHPQPIAPAPSPGVGRAPPVLRPMPATGVIPQTGMNSPYAQSPLMQQQPMLSEGDQPTHVVGSQGRRGILPSAPGRPAAPAAGQGKTPIPQKDADGKFPCPHCTKTYLHAKHLKRHLLRHTGDRPYMCVLCRDTFSRSDILKRHFIKCSVRRGNPTGATHLSHPQAHVKKNPTQQKGMGGDGDVNHVNGMGSIPGADGMIHPFGLVSAPDGLNNIANDQSQLSRSSSIQRIDDANRDRRSMTSSVMGATTRGGSFDQAYNGGDVTSNMGANINPSLGQYVPQNQNGMQMFGGSGSTDWSQMFPTGAHHSYVNSFSPNVGQTQTAIKQEPNQGAARAVGIPGGSPTDSNIFPSWGITPAFPNSYQQLSTKIIHFLTPQGSHAPTNGSVSFVFQAAHIRELLDNYTHFHNHFAILHIPTFRIMDAYVGLLAGMCCIGACYSQFIPSANIREVMDCLEAALEGSSPVYAALMHDGQYDYHSFGNDKTDIEELQAVMLTQALITWHGTPMHRERARRVFPLIASFSRRAGLLRVSKNATLYSPIHQPDFSLQTFNTATFDWALWAEQEKRIRIMYFIFLSDVALGLYFNRGPEFDTFEMELPLPTDDAAWDAGSSDDCAEALGLHGAELAKRRNPDGTQRCNQPAMHLVLKALLDPSYQIQPGASNLYGKFILIHALLAMMRRVQLDGSAALINRSSTPLPPTWFVGAANGHNHSGRVTPVQADANLLDRQTVKTLVTALEKFKSNWDNDMATQFPPSMTPHPRRYGFSRDGIHFYWLANYLLKHTRSADLQVPPDQRFTQVIHLLKSVKNWVLSDGASRGEELGSVGDIDAAYGATDLTLDMAQLFRPLPGLSKSSGITPPQAGTTRNGNGGMM